MKIEANMPCWLVGLIEDQAGWNGRVVTTKRREGGAADTGEWLVGWYIAASWLPPGMEGWVAEVHLKPITDPDADLTETHETRSTDPAGESLLEGEMA